MREDKGEGGRKRFRRGEYIRQSEWGGREAGKLSRAPSACRCVRGWVALWYQSWEEGRSMRQTSQSCALQPLLTTLLIGCSRTGARQTSSRSFHPTYISRA